MARPSRRALSSVLLPVAFTAVAHAQKPLTWEDVREQFRANNPSLQAGQTFVQENRANEVTAGLRPNPQLSIIEDEFHVWNPNPLQPFQNAQLTHTVTQLWERQHKRQLRVASAELATAVSAADAQDLERNLLFALRDAFIRVLQAKSIQQLAGDNLAYYDKVIEVNRQRYQAGDISRSDLERVELQRAQFQSDLINARVNLRTAKIQLLALMEDKRPVDRFDVTGDFDFRETILLPEELHRAAVDARPDLKSADTLIRKAEADNKLAWANGSTDPTIGVEYQRTGPDNTMGIDFAIPLRIFDRNQGEKARTALEIRRSQQIRQALVTSVFRDVDSAYAQLDSVRALLRPYRDQYLKQAADIRDTVSFAYARGGASLLDFLDAQKSYRDTELNYRNLIASYLSAANQLNLAVGREVIQ
ncbi:MAG TPA: TolC family protein [Bryobacteraceae bacterium]|nr:TolC family protein [Bryobacteraceae bacterium]